MKKNDIVTLRNQSYVLELRNDKLQPPKSNPCRDMDRFDVEEYPFYNEFKVVQTGLRLPSDKNGEYMDAIIQTVENGILLFVNERYLYQVEKEKMIDIDGKKWSLSTIKEALKKYAK